MAASHRIGPVNWSITREAGGEALQASSRVWGHIGCTCRVCITHYFAFSSKLHHMRTGKGQWEWHRHCDWLYELNLNSHYESNAAVHRLLRCWCWRWWWWWWWCSAMCSFPFSSFRFPVRPRCACECVCVPLTLKCHPSFKPLGVAFINTSPPLFYALQGMLEVCQVGLQSDLCESFNVEPLSLSLCVCLLGILSVDSHTCAAPKCMLHLGII